MQRLTIRKEIFLIGLGFLIALSVIFILMQSVILYRSGMEAARLRIAVANKQIASYVEAHLEGLAAAVKIMAANPDVIKGNQELMERILSSFRFIEESNPNVKYCYAGYENGKLLINDYIPPAGFDPKTRPWYRSAVARYPELSIGFLYQDIKSGEEKLKLLAATDDLTGLWNRRHFMNQAEYEIAQAQRHGRPLCIIQMDVDQFKKINDTHGHAAGDKVLKFLASSLKEQLRSTDSIGRIGGEEFVILLPNTDLQTATAVAEKIRNFFESSRVNHDGKMSSITISMGITSLCSGNNHIDILLRQADEAC